MRRFLALSVLTFILVTPYVYAQDDVSQKTTIQAGYGTVTMGGVQWQRFSFRPDIPLGKFGVGLDIEMFIDDKGKISDEGWDFSNSNNTIDTILRKIYYLRYGKPQDRFFARAGALDDVTLGYGLIMDGYRNTLSYPADKNLGFDLSVRDIGTFGIGVHAMINSFGDFKNEGAVVGGRVSVMPLKPISTPLISKLTFGATFVKDLNQFAGLKDSDDDGYPDSQDGYPDDKSRFADSDRDGYEDSEDIDADGDNWLDPPEGTDPYVEIQDSLNIKEESNDISVLGFDVGIPLIEGTVRLDLYGQYSKIITGEDSLEGGWGIGAPGLRLIVQRFKGMIEFRHFDGPFRPNYFDNLYDHERVSFVGNKVETKDMRLVDETLNGVYGKLGYNFFDMMSAEVSYQNMTGDQTFQDLIGKIKIHDRFLDHVPKIALVEGYFYNTYVDTDKYGLTELTPNTFYGTRIGFELTPSMLIVWDTRYTFTENEAEGLDKHRFVGIETVLSVK